MRRHLDLCERNFKGADQDVAAIVLVDLQFVQLSLDYMEQEVDGWPPPLRPGAAIVVVSLYGNPSSNFCTRRPDPDAQAALLIDLTHKGGSDLHDEFVATREVGRQEVVEDGPLRRVWRPPFASVALRLGCRLSIQVVAYSRSQSITARASRPAASAVSNSPDPPRSAPSHHDHWPFSSSSCWRTPSS